MELETQADCDHANTKFNVFHDGFLREIRWRSPMQFRSSMPWEDPKEFATNDARLWATGMTPLGEESLTLIIAHYNYDWPNQPETRAVVVSFFDHIHFDHDFDYELVIMELRFSKTSDATACTIRWESFGPPDGESIPDSTFSARRVRLEELDLPF